MIKTFISTFRSWAVENIGKAITLVGSLGVWLGAAAGYLTSAYDLLGTLGQ